VEAAFDELDIAHKFEMYNK